MRFDWSKSKLINVKFDFQLTEMHLFSFFIITIKGFFLVVCFSTTIFSLFSLPINFSTSRQSFTYLNSVSSTWYYEKTILCFLHFFIEYFNIKLCKLSDLLITSRVWYFLKISFDVVNEFICFHVEFELMSWFLSWLIGLLLGADC